MNPRGRRIAADIGGTFTDIAYLTDDGRLMTKKISSTPENYADAVVDGITGLIDDSPDQLADVADVLHGSTIATNAIIERKGARTALLTTKGFRDVLELRRIRVPTLYDPLYVKPAPLVPRELRFEVNERMNAAGGIVTSLDPTEIERLLPHIEASDVEAIAVCFLHSYANPAHEQLVGEILRKVLPETFVSLSSDVLPQIREYERTSTTVVNSYVGPTVKRYLTAMTDRLNSAGTTGRLMVMQSSGGVIDADQAIEIPAQIIECGPAAGVVGALRAGLEAGYKNLITFDMGGTTAKASLIENGDLTKSDEYEVGGAISASNSLVSGGGYALKLPVIDIAEVGAGGGSIIWLDAAGATKVGPQSAGASPGPACYGIGGDAPTVTDANVVLGYLNPVALAGGALPIQIERARTAIDRRIAQPLGRSVIEAAHGIHMVANANMTRVVTAFTTYRGRDPRDFMLFAFGGNGGVHATDLARELRIGRVVIPPAAGVFSAVGLLKADMETGLTHAFMHPLANMPIDLATRVFADLAARVSTRLGQAQATVKIQRFTDIRYAGQAFELTVEFADGPIGDTAIAEIARRFEDEHERRYGHAFSGDYPLETVNLRVTGRIAASPTTAARLSTSEVAGGEREVYFGPAWGTVGTPVIPRSALSDTSCPGPLIVEEYEGTTVVPPDSAAKLDPTGNIVIDVGPVQ
jgi:N-methylhydantoinase A